MQKDSVASDKGLISGDIIRRINQKKINSVKELMLEINKALDEKRKGILMLIETNKKTDNKLNFVFSKISFANLKT